MKDSVRGRSARRAASLRSRHARWRSAAADAGADVRLGVTVEGVHLDDAGRATGVYGHDRERCAGRPRRPVRRRRGRARLAGRPGGRRRGHRGPGSSGRGAVRVLRGPALARHRTDRRRPRTHRGLPHPPRRSLRLDLQPRPGTPARRAAPRRPARTPSPHTCIERRPSWPRACARDAARHRSRACCARRTTCAGPTARAGRWSATPATTATRSPATACPTRTGTPNCSPTALHQALRGDVDPDTALAGYQRRARQRVAQRLRADRRAGQLPASCAVRRAAEDARRAPSTPRLPNWPPGHPWYPTTSTSSPPHNPPTRHERRTPEGEPQ